MQNTLPEGEVFLARVDKPFLFDFRRNNILIVDEPGNASSPPGLPLFKGAEAVAQYLLSKSIRFVVFSYAN